MILSYPPVAYLWLVIQVKRVVLGILATKCYKSAHLWFIAEPLYNGHFGTSHFWVIFAVIQRFSSFRGKNVLAWYHWDCKTCP